MEKSKGKPRKYLSAVSLLAQRIMELLKEENRPLTNNEIANYLNVNIKSLFRATRLCLEKKTIKEHSEKRELKFNKVPQFVLVDFDLKRVEHFVTFNSIPYEVENKVNIELHKMFDNATIEYVKRKNQRKNENCKSR